MCPPEVMHETVAKAGLSPAGCSIRAASDTSMHEPYRSYSRCSPNRRPSRSALGGQLPTANHRVNAAVALIEQRCGEESGRLITTGIGKAGLIAQKIAATFASTGTPAQFLHPAEARHGD